MIIYLFIVMMSAQIFSAPPQLSPQEGVYMDNYSKHFIYVKGDRTCILIPHYGGYTIRDLGTVMENEDKNFLKKLKKIKDIDSKDYDNPKIQTCLMSKKESVQAFEGNWENPKESK